MTTLALLIAHLLLFVQSLPFPGPGGVAAGGGGCGLSCTPPASGMTLWLAADCITYTSGSCGSLPANGASITTWADKSGNGNGASYNNGTQWTFHNPSINSLPSVTVFNSNNFLNSGIVSSSGYSAFAVIEFNAIGSGTKQDLFHGGTAFKWWFTNVEGVDSGGVAQIGTGTTTLSASTWYQANVTYVNNTTSLNFRLNKTTDTTSGASASNMTGSIGAFGSNGSSGELLNAQLAELILYNRVLSGSEITTIESYFHNRYGL